MRLQKRKDSFCAFVPFLFVILLFVLVSLSSTSGMLTYAVTASSSPSHYEVTIKARRGSNSQVGSVLLADQTTNVNTCRPITQGPTILLNTLDAQDHITIQLFPNAQCSPFAGRMPAPSFTNLVRKLQGTSCGTNCVVYETPQIAAAQSITLKVMRGNTSGVGAVRVTSAALKFLSCVDTPTQGKLFTVGTFDITNRIDVVSYSDAQCKNGTGKVLTNTKIGNLPDCGVECRYFKTA